MPMLIIKSYKTILVSLILFISGASVCQAESQFVEQFQVQPTIDMHMANRITQYHSEDISLPLAQQKTELLNIDKQLAKLQNQHSEQAVFWFIRGLHYKNMASFYNQSNNTQLTKSYINSKNTAYKKAISLNHSTRNKLSAAIFSTMKPGLSEDLKIQATKKEIALGGNGDNDSYYWYLHWSNIDQLEKAGREDEAKAAYKQMQKELKSSGMDMSVYDSLTNKIETDTLKKHSNAPKKKPKSAQKEQSKELVKAKKYDTKVIVISSIAILSAMSIIGVIIYEIKRKKKRKVKR